MEEKANELTARTLAFYNQNADGFISGTISVDFSEVQNRFLSLLPPGASILDFGCGSGRDTKAFLERGYQVTATDGSPELCRAAAQFTGIPVRCQLFQELNETERYDGIWACASILHVPKRELPELLEKLRRALKNRGILYTSFKYGSFEGIKNGRYFTCFTENTFQELAAQNRGLAIEEIWTTGDARPGREAERWLNLILRKADMR